MAGRFFEWTPDDSPGFVLPTTTDRGWDELREVYSPTKANGPLDRVLEIAQGHDVRSVIVERRYIDLDYRSEHSNFYSTTFLRYPSVCHRLHFFAADVNADLSNLSQLHSAYRGYSVMRPLASSPVGRTMLVPPEELDDAIVCSASDTIHLWGHRFSVSGMPFVSQDAQYLRCAHSCLWMVLYHGFLCHGLPRRLPHEIHRAATGGQVIGRQLPSDGLTPAQVLKALYEMNMSGGHIELPESRDESRNLDPELSLFGILCRYVNSNMPPIVYSPEHAWVVVGYAKRGTGHAHDLVTLYRHDDRRGPYLKVESPWQSEGELAAYAPWTAAIPPLPQKVYMTGERAEYVAGFWISEAVDDLEEDNPVRRAIDDDRLTLRTYAIRSYVYKEEVTTRLPEPLARLYQLAHCPRWVWVVEALDRDLLDAGSHPVIGEVVIDATASDLATADDPVILAAHLGTEASVFTPDHSQTLSLRLDPMEPYESGRAFSR